jgi:synaptobrevin family protein YKT6
MRILSIHLYKWQADSPVNFGAVHELGFIGYFQRKVVRDLINFSSRTVVGRSRPGDRTAVHLEQEAGICYVAVHPNSLAVTVVADPEYPQRVAFTVIAEIMRELIASSLAWPRVVTDTDMGWPRLNEYLRTYQNPMEADRLMKIQSELDQVTEVMHRNIEELLKRGETLDSLMAKSNDLGAMSYDFYKRAKKNNQCCKLY